MTSRLHHCMTMAPQQRLGRGKGLTQAWLLQAACEKAQGPFGRGLGGAHPPGAEDVPVGEVLRAQVPDGQPRQHDPGAGVRALGQLVVDDVPLRVHDLLVLRGVAEADLQQGTTEWLSLQPRGDVTARNTRPCILKTAKGISQSCPWQQGVLLCEQAAGARSLGNT